MSKLLFFITLFFIACSNNNVNIAKENKNSLLNNEPSWIKDPIKAANGKVTAVGCSARHYNGIAAQKKLALQRAIDEIAMQTKTKVSKVSLNRKTNTSSYTNSTSLQEVNSQNVSVKIMQYYTSEDGDICVWVIKN
jgi:hypothetical protein